MTPATENPSFEQAYAALAQIVSQLESGGLSLEDSLRLFKQGQDLVKRCSAQLDAAELEVETLLNEDDAE